MSALVLVCFVIGLAAGWIIVEVENRRDDRDNRGGE
jgi:uncharacterized membrane protein YciS (DUF1049 family)